MHPDIQARLRRVELALQKSANKNLPLELKLKMSELALNLMRRRKKFGLLVILGWQKKWGAYADTPDISQDIFAQQRINIMNVRPPAPRARGTARARQNNIVNTVNFDGAILIDPKGSVLHSGAMIEGLRPRATAHKINPRRAPDLSSQFGFKRKVHMRHITAITSSYQFRGTTVFTISEETDDFHVFENGRIVYSTVRGEIML